MTSNEPPARAAQDEFWRDFLTRGHSAERAARRVFRLVPHAPRPLELRGKQQLTEVVALTVRTESG